VCDLETSRMGAPYIYDISRLRVNYVPKVLMKSPSVQIKKRVVCLEQVELLDV